VLQHGLQRDPLAEDQQILAPPAQSRLQGKRLRPPAMLLGNENASALEQHRHRLQTGPGGAVAQLPGEHQGRRHQRPVGGSGGIVGVQQALPALEACRLDGRRPALCVDSKMIASLMPILNMLTSADLGPLLSPDAADTRDTRRLTSMAECIERAQVVYLGLDALSDSMVGGAIGSILVADLAAVAGDRYNSGVNLTPVNVFIDEAAEVVNDPFIQLLNKGRGAGLRLTVATQTFADFAARTGSEAKARQVLGNINNLVALRVLDAETQQYVTDSLPKTRLKSMLLTQGSTTDSRNPLLYTGNVGERLGEEEGDLFPPALLGQLPNLHYLAVLAGGRIVKGRLPILGMPKGAA
jgi:hypothetical protein